MSWTATAPRIVVVGHGLLGEPLGNALRIMGATVVTVAHRSADNGVDLAADLTTGPGRRALAALLAEQQPTCVVLVHGPGDVTWIEGNEKVARDAHVGTARAVSSHQVLLVSTDNVFDGTAPPPADTDPVSPGNAYGRVKLAAERAVLAGPAPATIVRLSMVYGWSAPGRRATYGHRCIQAARAGQSIVAPIDQHFTPLHVDDAIRALVRLAFGFPGDRIFHFAGPVELSRHEFARLAYAAAGADPELVVPVPLMQTEWACRPRRSRLRNSDPAVLAPWLDWRPMEPLEGLKRMVHAAPARPPAVPS
jgi:dTDP-4-dehydrorhamnose reductase